MSSTRTERRANTPTSRVPLKGKEKPAKRGLKAEFGASAESMKKARANALRLIGRESL